jgi:hypothetical protein
MNRFVTIDLDSFGRFGVAVTYGKAEEPKLRLLCTASEHYARRLTEKLNSHNIQIDPPAPSPDPLIAPSF